MIKTLSNISDISVIEQNGFDDIVSFSNIDFVETELGSGGFGAVHKVHAIDGVTTSGYVLKLITAKESMEHAYEVIKLLHTKLKKRQKQVGLYSYHDMPELLGLPFLVFKAHNTFLKEDCVAMLMYNLDTLNFQDYGSDTATLDEYINLDLPSKLYLAYQLTKAIDFLHQINFIHSDISENSLWFNTEKLQFALIDYDSGYHFDIQKKPTTIGKISHWVGRSFRSIIGQKKGSSRLTSLNRLHEEYWVLANAVFEVVFGVMPFFFLKDTDDKTKQDYLNKFAWPNIDYSSPLFNKSNINQHQIIIKFIDNLEKAGAKDLVQAFKKVFNKGYNDERKRLDSKSWKKLLFDLNQSVDNKPNIENFTANKSTITRRNEDVKFSFAMKKANTVYLNDKLVPLNQNFLSLSIFDDTEVVLRAVNDFGQIEETIKIEALRVTPKIKVFSSSKLIRDTLDPINLYWKVKDAASIIITQDKEEGKEWTPKTNYIEVEPIEDTTYTLTAIGHFGEKSSQNIRIEVIRPIIKTFTWEVNLHEGIDNVDIIWDTQHTNKVTIYPKVASNETAGLAHVKLQESTVFKLIAEGLFGSEEKEIIAKPFPVPIIKQIFTPAPNIEINTQIDFKESNLPLNLLKNNRIHISNDISFNSLDFDISNFGFPEFTKENILMDNAEIQKSSLLNIYDRILSEIHKRLNR